MHSGYCHKLRLFLNTATRLSGMGHFMFPKVSRLSCAKWSWISIVDRMRMFCIQVYEKFVTCSIRLLNEIAKLTIVEFTARSTNNHTIYSPSSSAPARLAKPLSVTEYLSRNINVFSIWHRMPSSCLDIHPTVPAPALPRTLCCQLENSLLYEKRVGGFLTNLCAYTLMASPLPSKPPCMM